jgi:co-chaperonin GroES (HSP10)
MNIKPINGNLILKLGELPEKTEKGVLLSKEQAMTYAMDFRKSFEVKFAPADSEVKAGDKVYMHPKEFTPEQIALVTYDDEKVIVTNVFSVLGISNN